MGPNKISFGFFTILVNFWGWFYFTEPLYIFCHFGQFLGLVLFHCKSLFCICEVWKTWWNAVWVELDTVVWTSKHWMVCLCTWRQKLLTLDPVLETPWGTNFYAHTQIQILRHHYGTPWLTPLDFLPFWSIFGVGKISLQITLLHLWSVKNMMKCNLSWIGHSCLNFQLPTIEWSVFAPGGRNFSLCTLFWKHHEGPTCMHILRFRF